MTVWRTHVGTGGLHSDYYRVGRWALYVLNIKVTVACACGIYERIGEKVNSMRCLTTVSDVPPSLSLPSLYVYSAPVGPSLLQIVANARHTQTAVEYVAGVEALHNLSFY